VRLRLGDTVLFLGEVLAKGMLLVIGQMTESININLVAKDCRQVRPPTITTNRSELFDLSRAS
jgi:hypothetical protein